MRLLCKDLCTTSMDKLGQLAYRTGKSLYRYKTQGSIPPLGMIDDILAVSECGTQSVKTNATITSFIDSKKLKLSDKVQTLKKIRFVAFLNKHIFVSTL